MSHRYVGASAFFACIVLLASSVAADEAALQRKIDAQDELIHQQAEQLSKMEDRLRAIEDARAKGGDRQTQETMETPKETPLPPPNAPQPETRHIPNTGFSIVQNEYGSFNLRLYTYARYVNQMAWDKTYKDSFGNIKELDRRQDIQLNKVKLETYGWLGTEKLRYVLYVWTANASQGQGAQVVVAGNLRYEFNPHFALAAGITSLPGTRSTSHQFPFWLGVDNRLIADEYFRPSYTSGIWAFGEIVPGLDYFTMIGNNLSTLGVDAGQLDAKLDTISTTVSWEPTHDYGRAFGDYDWHENLSTRLAVHFTHSTETAQGQPNTDAFENSQIRISDGNQIFQAGLFGPGIQIQKARYQMGSIDGGLKFHGLSLEGEYFFRLVDQFSGTLTDSLGFSNFKDHGFQMQASAMLVPEVLQLYVGGSKIFGQFGEPWDSRVGFNWFPFANGSFRWNNEIGFYAHSPVGGIAYPYQVGGNGFLFQSNLELAF
jgi:hypothetical protein